MCDNAVRDRRLQISFFSPVQSFQLHIYILSEEIPTICNNKVGNFVPAKSDLYVTFVQ